MHILFIIFFKKLKKMVVDFYLRSSLNHSLNHLVIIVLHEGEGMNPPPSSTGYKV